jgi:hypothetical protein
MTGRRLSCTEGDAIETILEEHGVKGEICEKGYRIIR